MSRPLPGKTWLSVIICALLSSWFSAVFVEVLVQSVSAAETTLNAHGVMDCSLNSNLIDQLRLIGGGRQGWQLLEMAVGTGTRFGSYGGVQQACAAMFGAAGPEGIRRSTFPFLGNSDFQNMLFPNYVRDVLGYNDNLPVFNSLGQVVSRNLATLTGYQGRCANYYLPGDTPPQGVSSEELLATLAPSKCPTCENTILVSGAPFGSQDFRLPHPEFSIWLGLNEWGQPDSRKATCENWSRTFTSDFENTVSSLAMKDVANGYRFCGIPFMSFSVLYQAECHSPERSYYCFVEVFKHPENGTLSFFANA